MVQPQADGSATYNWAYLPDPDNTYSIQQHAYLSKFTLDATLANGLLAKVNDQSDSSGLASKLLDAAQSTYAAKQQAMATQAKTDTATLSSAKTAATAAALSLQQAQEEMDILNADKDATAPQKLAAKLKVADAKLAAAQTQKAVDDLQAQKDQGVQQQSVQQLAAAGQTQWGPIMFRLVQDNNGGAKLVQVNTQANFPTVGVPTPPKQGGG